MNGAKKLRQLLAQDGVLQAGGVADAGQARLVQKVGYPVAYLSGAYVNHTRGYPDGVLTLPEIAQRVQEITDRIDIPLIADGDEGFGDALKIQRTIRDFERAGAAGLHMEDMIQKKHGDPLPIPRAVDRLKCLLDSRRDDDFVVIARTDAVAPWRPGVHDDLVRCEQDALERMHAYAEAGADLVMPLYASMDWVRRHGRDLPKPVVILGGAARSWMGHAAEELELDMTAAEMGAYNVKVVIYGTSMLSRSFNFMEKEYRKWLAEGRFAADRQDEIDRIDANNLVGLPEKEALLSRYTG
ncbi:oxaloacetate decarboxylase [Pigmentiphaga soli]|uniref:Oxaloacetate decarboxylase n=1 Tax=Pigmentiphaga soli TaxID=1007095 RepID=A0ABP8GH80_9BURK